MNQEAQLPLTTSLNKILACNPCLSGWNALVTSLGKEHLLAEECPSEDLDTADDAPLKFSHILETNGLNDVLWSLRSAPEFSKQWRTFAVWSARQVQHLMTDARSLEALDVADRHIAGLATDHELDTARDAARAAAAWAATRDAQAVKFLEIVGK